MVDQLGTVVSSLEGPSPSHVDFHRLIQTGSGCPVPPDRLLRGGFLPRPGAPRAAPAGRHRLARRRQGHLHQGSGGGDRAGAV